MIQIEIKNSLYRFNILIKYNGKYKWIVLINSFLFNIKLIYFLFISDLYSIQAQ